MPNGLPALHRTFTLQDSFKADPAQGYSLLPFQFIPLDDRRYVLTNLAGEFLVVPHEVLHQLVLKRLPMDSQYYLSLKSQHFLADADSSICLELLAAKYRTKQIPLSEFTSLHIFVPTLRCNNRCVYCQASRQGPTKPGYDMKWEDAEKAINFMFRSPARSLKVEFQGGEPLLAFPLIKQVVGKVEEINQTEARNVEFVICSNLSLVSDEVLDFCGAHNIYFSTSLDGPRALHNANRPSSDFDSYERAITGIACVQDVLGSDKVSALATTTRTSLAYPVEIVDEYIRQRFNAIFLRPLNPYGLAARGNTELEYEVEEWLAFYVRALKYILELNYQGVPFREQYAALILRKMLTPYGTGFVDLRSPAGVGIAVILFNHDGGIYASDESRMLAEMGDERFRLGSLSVDSYEDVMLSDSLISLLRETMAEGVPCCSDCGIQPFCGSDPVRHYRTQGDPIGNKPTSEFCARNIGLIKHLIQLLEDDAQAAKVLRSWI